SDQMHRHEHDSDPRPTNGADEPPVEPGYPEHPEQPHPPGHLPGSTADGHGPARAHRDDDGHAGHSEGGHEGHDKHAGHSVAMFRNKFWISLLLTIPTVLWGHMLARLTGWMPPMFAGSEW